MVKLLGEKTSEIFHVGTTFSCNTTVMAETVFKSVTDTDQDVQTKISLVTTGQIISVYNNKHQL